MTFFNEWVFQKLLKFWPKSVYENLTFSKMMTRYFGITLRLVWFQPRYDYHHCHSYPFRNWYRFFLSSFLFEVLTRRLIFCLHFVNNPSIRLLFKKYLHLWCWCNHYMSDFRALFCSFLASDDLKPYIIVRSTSVFNLMRQQKNLCHR